jgi:hypothetical protein
MIFFFCKSWRWEIRVKLAFRNKKGLSAAGFSGSVSKAQKKSIGRPAEQFVHSLLFPPPTFLRLSARGPLIQQRRWRAGIPWGIWCAKAGWPTVGTGQDREGRHRREGKSQPKGRRPTGTGQQQQGGRLIQQDLLFHPISSSLISFPEEEKKRTGRGGRGGERVGRTESFSWPPNALWIIWRKICAWEK